ncbi:protein REVERSION-TO-ETHYLENE SENSITIVITY1 isoform X2 [Panicum hallii]|uniref:protein REVERSION-TO-ETHYLENE SENSITIVITY1 isoform X2 n=1 Tax=Panicum hallii TaxID=206008 RepID=UPI000DF4DCA2|nr:protein REVERSION-TO-ETHYLENE SENSITIVITY1 isoform X2 [Panicum hallii]
MSPKVLSSMELEADFDGEDISSTDGLQELWPLGEIDPKRARFPCCIVWTPLPVVSWLAPYIGHVGICQEDGAVLDFAGSNLVSVDNFAYGSVARYLQLDRKKVVQIAAFLLTSRLMYVSGHTITQKLELRYHGMMLCNRA